MDRRQIEMLAQMLSGGGAMSNVDSQAFGSRMPMIAPRANPAPMPTVEPSAQTVPMPTVDPGNTWGGGAISNADSELFRNSIAPVPMPEANQPTLEELQRMWQLQNMMGQSR